MASDRSDNLISLPLCSNSMHTIEAHCHAQVYETILFSARLRLPQMASHEIKDRVDEIVNSFGLAHVRNSNHGNHKRGVSGGERRRVFIAVEVCGIKFSGTVYKWLGCQGVREGLAAKNMWRFLLGAHTTTVVPIEGSLPLIITRTREYKLMETGQMHGYYLYALHRCTQLVYERDYTREKLRNRPATVREAEEIW